MYEEDVDESNQSHQLPAADSRVEVGPGAPHDEGVIDTPAPGESRSYGGYERLATPLQRAIGFIEPGRVQAAAAPDLGSHALDAETVRAGNGTADAASYDAVETPGDSEDVTGPVREGDAGLVVSEAPSATLVSPSGARGAGLVAWGRSILPLTLILLIAAALRLYGYNWDAGTDLHPDERGIVGHIQSLGLPHSLGEFWSPASSLNPHFSAYGHLPFYLTAIFAHTLAFLGSLGGIFGGLANAATTDQGIIHSGRILSGLADTGTLVFVFLIGRLVYSRGAGLLAAGLGAFTVLDLEFAHFANVDTFLACCTTGAVYFCLRIVREGRWTSYLWAGAWIGFALACKVSAAPLLVPLVVAHAYRGSSRAATVLSPDDKEVTTRLGRLPANPLLLLLALVSTVVAVFVTMPYAFIDFSNWWSDVWYQLQLAQGIIESPFTRKFSNLPSYWYPLQQLIGWTMGLPLGLAAVVGLLVAVGRQIRRRNGMEMVLLSWAIVFFVLAGSQYMKFLRYMLPLAPILTIFAAALLVRLWTWARSPGSSPRRLLAPLGFAVVAAVVLLNTLYGLAHESIYTAENTRLAATRWMAANIPANTAITVEDWDETLPISGAPNVILPPYRSTTLTILGQNADSATTTVPQFVNALQADEYITISSARVLGSVAHQPQRYPYSIRWYQGLFSGALGFRLVKSFVSEPHLGPITINDTQAVPSATEFTGTHLWYEADQNLSEYDSPAVYIFKRASTVSPAKATALLTDNGRLQPSYAAYDPTHPMTLPKEVQQADQKAPPLNASFPAGNPLDAFPLLGWLVVVELLGLLALPLVLRACRGLLRDGGFALAKTAGIVVVAYLVWIAASLHLATYSRGLILGACAVLLVLSLTLGLGPREVWRELKARRRPIIMAELVFLGAFLVMVAIRAAYPDLWHINYGGERSQEISFTNSILRSQYFPPADPWFAGGTLNYYYYGQYLTGMLMKLTGIPLPISFNLALPTLYALLLSTAFAIGYNATGRAWVGAMAAALEGVVGNLGPVQQMAALAPVHAPSSLVPGIAGLRDAVGGLFAVLGGTAQLSPSFFWTSSRILATPPPSSDGVINEFPIWSFTYGDMHAHVVDTPIVLCAVALALAVSGLGIGRTDAASLAAPRLKLGTRTWIALGLLMAVIVGATGPTNLWDLPTSVFLVTVGFGLRGWFVEGRRGWTLLLRDILVPGAVLGVACLLLYRPFYATVLGISSGFTFIQPLTPTDQWLLHFGLPLFLLVSFLALFLWRTLDLPHAFERLLLYREFEQYYRDRSAALPRLSRISRTMMRRSRSGRIAPTLLSGHILIAGIAATLAMAGLSFSTLALTAALLTVALIAFVEACARWRRLDWRESQPFGLALAIIGLGLTAIPDLVMQNEASRMNTFFKLYNQAWPLIALGGALSMYGVVSMRRRSAPAVDAERVPARPITTMAPVFASAKAMLRPVPALALPGGGSFTPAGRIWSVGAGGRSDGDEAARPEQPAALPADREARAPMEANTGPDSDGRGVETDAGLVAGEWVAHPYEGTAATNAVSSGDAGAVSGGSSLEHDSTDGRDDRNRVAADPGDGAAMTHESGVVTPAAAPVGAASVRQRRDLLSVLNRVSYASVLWWTALVALIGGAALFPIFGIYNHLQIRSIWAQEAAVHVPTGLDGGAFVRVLYPGDWAAINWINDHISGDPVLLTSDRGSYTNFATKVTMFTGLPTISTWSYEDGQERYSGQNRPGKDYPTNWVNQMVSGAVTWNGSQWVTNVPHTAAAQTATRQADVETIYNTTDTSQAMALLKEYHVSYIYVGIAERGDPFLQGDETTNFGRVGFDPAGLAKFDQMVSAKQLSIAYPKTQGVEIYKVVGT